MLELIRKQAVKDRFLDLYLDYISDFDIEFLYNYIIHTRKIKERYLFNENNIGCC